jgi:redox-sensitive bicupin YhaK (pirin superfamily)
VVARVVFGSSNGVDAAAQTPTPGARLVDLTLAPGARFSQELDDQENCFAWVFAGSAHAEVPTGLQPLTTFDLVGYAQGGRRISLHAGDDGARIAICGGPPLDQPVVASGPFVMSTQADIQNAVAAYRSGAMGQLSQTLYGAEGRPLPI